MSRCPAVFRSFCLGACSIPAQLHGSTVHLLVDALACRGGTQRGDMQAKGLGSQA